MTLPSSQSLLGITALQRNSWRLQKPDWKQWGPSSGTTRWGNGLITGLLISTVPRCCRECYARLALSQSSLFHFVLQIILTWSLVRSLWFQEVHQLDLNNQNHNIYASNFIPLWIEENYSGKHQVKVSNCLVMKH